MNTITIDRAILEQAISVLEAAKNGLLWYQDTYPDVTDCSDNEANDEIDSALETIRAELAKQPVKKSWNRAIRDSVDALLAEAGYEPDSSARHQLGMMNFDGEVQSPPSQHVTATSDATCVELTKDAARYQCLRDNGDTGCTEKDGYGGYTLMMGDRLDAAVDAVIAKSKEGTE